MYTPDFKCDLCHEWILGPVYFRDDVLACRSCAKQINRFKDFPTFYGPLFLWPVAAVLGLMVLYLELLPLLAIGATLAAIFLFLVGGLMLLK